MKKFFVALLLLAFVATVQAQHIAVKDFYYAENDLTARTHGTSEEDQNGNLCALIKVETTEKGMWTFDVGMLGVTKIEMQNESHSAEIWVYVPFGVTWMTIQHEHLGKLKHYQFPCSIEKGCTYVMELVTGRVETIVKEEIRQQYLTFQISPVNAMLEVDGQLWEVGPDGSSTGFVDFGTYNYRVQAPNYRPEVGKVTVDDPKNAHKVPINLKSDLVQVTLQVDTDAEIWVNDEKKGVGSWTGPLGKGTYKIECKQASHETTLTTKKITADMNGKTITLPAPTPIYGSLSIESTPNYAKIYIDDELVDETPKFISEILIGQHELRVTKEGFSEYKGTITIGKGENKQVKATMTNLDYEEIAKKGDEYYDSKNYEEALKCYREAAEHGNAVGQYGMGRLYDGGYAVQQDYAEAIGWFRKSANQGYAGGQHGLGWMYYSGHGVVQDYVEAVKWYRRAAEQGLAKSQSQLGAMYAEGVGITQDDAEAIKWFRKSAEQGNDRAQFQLGFMYLSGRGVTQDYTEAIKWFRKSAEQGNEQGQWGLGQMYYEGLGVAQDDTEAFKWFRKSAEQGYVESQYTLGFMYYNGTGVIQDYAEAIKWFRKAADQGHALAQGELGYLYAVGQGVTQDYNEAIKWFRKSADQGDVIAQKFLGQMYYEGLGVTQNYVEAIKWFRKLAEQGDTAMQVQLGYMYAVGQGVIQDYSEAERWYRKAADQGDPEGQYSIGVLYENGYGVRKSTKEAKKWYRLAADQGLEDAINAFNRLK